MKRLISGVQVLMDGRFFFADLELEGGIVSRVIPKPAQAGRPHLYAMPGFVDVHVHLREPGFSYKETIRTGTMAAAHGGYTAVCAMPNLNPMPDCMAGLRPQLDIIARDACVRVYPYGTITQGEAGRALSDMDALAGHVVAFSDDGRGVQDADLMRAAMVRAKSLGKLIVAHCEDNALLQGGYIHDGAYARAHGHAGICSRSEWGPIARDLDLVRETGCGYHVCHISTKESVSLIRQAKAQGLNVTCETAPHYLLMDDGMLEEDGRFKMNPPLRSPADREALLEGLADGTIDMIATDHAPHAAAEKSRGLKDSAMCVVGLETAFPLLYTHLVRRMRLLSLERLVALMSTAPAARFGLPCGIREGAPADITLYDLDKSHAIDPETFLSMGRATPFAGWEVRGECAMTICKGEAVWNRE